MEKGFLLNRNHNFYLEKELTYKKYICKDCSQKKKEYESCKEDGCDPKTIPNLGYIEVSLGNQPIVLTTPLMVCPFGFNKGTNTLTLQFTNFKTDPEMNSFIRFIKELELEQMQYIGLDEDESDLYLSQIINIIFCQQYSQDCKKKNLAKLSMIYCRKTLKQYSLI